MSDAAFLDRMKAIYSNTYFMHIEQMIARLRSQGADKAADDFKAKYTCRMHDLSKFMKGLKQRFTQWYNGTHARRGTLWEGRFKSVLVQDGYAARVMAAYIDLNPIRAGMVSKPEDYKWCSYGEAMQSKGGEKAQAGICRVVAQNQNPQTMSEDVAGWNEGVAEQYRMLLLADGEEVFVEDLNSGELPENRKPKRVRKGFQRKEVEQVLARGGKLSIGEALRCKVRYFSDGMTLGNKAFVEKVFQGARERFGEKRQSGARSIREMRWKKTRLYSMRELVKNSLE